MTNKYYTSFKLSKLLKEAGCELESEGFITWDKSHTYCTYKGLPKGLKNGEIGYNTYHILEDICDKYCREFFGKERKYYNNVDWHFSYKYHSIKILEMLQQNKPKEEIEEYIWENCKFNPNNKEEK
jgi:hypothetical protein